MPGAARAHATKKATLIMTRGLVCILALAPLTSCKGPPARLVAGTADTVIVNNQRPVQLPIRVLDAAGHRLERTGVQYRWTGGMPIAVSATGVVKCAETGDVMVRASLGALVSNVLVRCRPVREVRATRMLNLVVGGPAQELPFAAIGLDSQLVTMLTGQVILEDSSIVAVDGQRVRALASGSTGLSMRVGDRLSYTSVHAYERVSNPEHIGPGQHVAVPVRLTGSEMRRWRFPPAKELYFFAMLPDGDEKSMPGLAIVGANCTPWVDGHSYFCLALHEASVTVYHPQQVDSAKLLSGTLAVWRQDR